MPTRRQHDHDGDTPGVDQTTPTVVTNDVAIILIQRDRQHPPGRSETHLVRVVRSSPPQQVTYCDGRPKIGPLAPVSAMTSYLV